MSEHYSPNAAVISAWFASASPSNRVGEGRREKYCNGASHLFEEVCGSTVEEEQHLVNIVSVANHIIKRVHQLDKLNRLRNSSLRTTNGQASLQVKRIGEIEVRNNKKFSRGVNGLNFCVEIDINRLQD